MDHGLDTLAQTKATMIDLAIRFGPKVLVALVIVTSGAFVASWVARASARSLAHWDLEPPVRQLLTRVARVLVLGLFVIMALQNLGVELLPLIAGLSVVGAGVALATQGVLSNAVAGLTIIFTKPYRVGEYIGIAGVEGRVDGITLFSTVLAHADRSRIVVPNRKIIGEILHNYGVIRQPEIDIRVAHEADLSAALAAIREVVQANPRVLADPAPVVQVVLLSESAVQVAVKPWVAVNDYGAVTGELNLAIADTLRERGFAIPYPQHAVRLVDSRAAADAS